MTRGHKIDYARWRQILGAIAQLEAEGTPAVRAQLVIEVPDITWDAWGVYAMHAKRRGWIVAGGRGRDSDGYHLTDAGRALLASLSADASDQPTRAAGADRRGDTEASALREAR